MNVNLFGIDKKLYINIYKIYTLKCYQFQAICYIIHEFDTSYQNIFLFVP